MTRKGILSLSLVLCMLATLVGCGKTEAAVYVQSVAELAALGGIAPGDRFAGLVVSENVAEIQKDSDKVIGELLVREGDDVTEGQELFSYDTDQLQLTVDKQRLELEQLNASIENYKEQIEDLEKDRNRVGTADKLQFTIQIQSLEVDLKEAELNVKTKEAELTRSENILDNATVVSPVTGRIQSISENGMDNYGNPLPYITIQQAGSYRIKGTLGELQRGGLMEGSRITVISRTDETARWSGTVTLVDYENPIQGNNNNYYYMGSSDEMTTASKYPFYVELDSTDGLILGQHVYMELAVEEDAPAGPAISSAFICFDEDGTCYVWAENRNKLEKRTVELGEMNDMLGTVEILSGLTEEDFIAFPDPELCIVGAHTTRDIPQEDAAEGEVG